MYASEIIESEISLYKDSHFSGIIRRLDISRKVRNFAEMKGEATVVKNAGSHYLLSCLPEWDLFPAVLRGRIRLKGSSATNPVAVGDRVSWEADDDARPTPEHPATITSVHEQRNYVIRRSTNLSRQAHVIAANVDEAFIIVSLYFPEIKLPFTDSKMKPPSLDGLSDELHISP